MCYTFNQALGLATSEPERDMTTWAEFDKELERINNQVVFEEARWYSCFGRKSEVDPMPSEAARKALAAISQRAEEMRAAALAAILGTSATELGPRQ
jgi:hypothetical protein